MSYRVAEINPAYDMIPGDGTYWELDPDSNGIMVERMNMRPGPGWIYVTNEIETIAEARILAMQYEWRTKFKTRIDKIHTQFCLTDGMKLLN